MPSFKSVVSSLPVILTALPSVQAGLDLSSTSNVVVYWGKCTQTTEHVQKFTDRMQARTPPRRLAVAQVSSHLPPIVKVHNPSATNILTMTDVLSKIRTLILLSWHL